MRFTLFLTALTIIPSIVYCQNPLETAPKRGLVYIPDGKHPQDDALWDTSALTWYYNYGSKPSPNISKLQFVPMLFGTSNSSTFLSDVRSQITAGANITYVLGFNEPDGVASTGGSDISPDTAAQIWMQQIEPLAKQGVKLGAPACTGAESGRLAAGFKIFSKLAVTALHWYSNFQGLASHIGEYVGTFNKSIWVTEFADANVSLLDSQTFYNQSSSFLDRNNNVSHYAWFGSFRSDVSNVGANSAMLTQDGKLTDIGSWYLGGGETGNVPKSDANRKLEFIGSGLFVGLATMWCIL